MRKTFEENMDPQGTNGLKWRTLYCEIKAFYYAQFQVIWCKLG